MLRMYKQKVDMYVCMYVSTRLQLHNDMQICTQVQVGDGHQF